MASDKRKVAEELQFKKTEYCQLLAKGNKMLRITMDMLCLDGYSEALPGEVEYTELVLESLVALILMDFSEIVVINKVRVICNVATSARQPLCLLQVEAICPVEAMRLPVNSLDVLEMKLENALCCALIELFSNVQMHKIHVRHEQEAWLDAAPLLRSAC